MLITCTLFHIPGGGWDSGGADSRLTDVCGCEHQLVLVVRGAELAAFCIYARCGVAVRSVGVPASELLLQVLNYSDVFS